MKGGRHGFVETPVGEEKTGLTVDKVRVGLLPVVAERAGASVVGFPGQASVEYVRVVVRQEVMFRRDIDAYIGRH